jgi:hypothetical protein
LWESVCKLEDAATEADYLLYSPSLPRGVVSAGGRPAMHHAEKMCIASSAWFNLGIPRRQDQFRRRVNLIDCELQEEKPRTNRRGALTINSKDLGADVRWRREHVNL